LEADNLQAVDLEGGAVGAETPIIAKLVILGICWHEYKMVRQKMRDERLVVSGRQSIRE
jgi:hypothetical protein